MNDISTGGPPLGMGDEYKYISVHHSLRAAIEKYCLPEQADKVIFTILEGMRDYDPQDTYRRVIDVISGIAQEQLGLNK